MSAGAKRLPLVAPWPSASTITVERVVEFMFMARITKPVDPPLPETIR